MWRFVISDQRLDEKDPFFYHKTTRRQFYDREMERQKALTGCDEVVFLNKKGELTEGTRTNLFIELDGRLFTPALTCGLLPGTLREELLDLPRAAASEAVLTPQDLLAADRIYLGNSVRGLVRAELMQPEREEAEPREADPRGCRFVSYQVVSRRSSVLAGTGPFGRRAFRLACAAGRRPCRTRRATRPRRAASPSPTSLAP